MTQLRRIAPRLLLVWACGCALSLYTTLAHAPLARAQPTAPDAKAAAEALFDEGLSLMQKGDFATACVKLEQSQSIDHGIGTMLYLAECYEKSGRTASAWALFRQAASEARAGGENERAEAGRTRAERLTPLLSKLTISVAEPAPAGLTLTRNGAGVPSALWGVAMPVDPGEQRVEANAPGHVGWSGSVNVGAKPGDSASLVVPALATATPSASATGAAVAPAPLALNPSAETAPAASANAQLTAGDVDADDDGSTQRIVGIVLGGAGVVAVGIGTVFGFQAIAKNDDAKSHCPNNGTTCTDQKGEMLSNDANDAATLANVFVFGGAALAVAGMVVYFTAPTPDQPTIALRSDGRSVRATFGGVF